MSCQDILSADLADFIADHRPHGPRRRHGARVEWLSAHRGMLVWRVVFERWITPEDAELDLLRAAGLN
jgi:hypothetical protein